jgi:hypothetical protein
MLADALPQLIDTLLRLAPQEAAQFRELIQHLPDPQACAQEMVRRGWISQDQLSSLVPGPPQRPTPREAMPLGFEDDERSPDADAGNWVLAVSDEEADGDLPPEVEWAPPDRTDEEMYPEPERVEAVPVLSGRASAPQFERDMRVPPVAGGKKARRRKCDTDKLLGQSMGWPTKGLVMGTVFLGSLFAGQQFFGANSSVPPMARQESREAKEKAQVPTGERGEASPQVTAAKPDDVRNNEVAAGDPARAADLPPVRRLVPIDDAKQRDAIVNKPEQNVQPAAPVTAPVVRLPVIVQGPPTPPPQEDAFSQWVRQQIADSQKRAMETAKQNIQMSQQFQDRVRREMSQMQEDIWRRHEEIIQNSRNLQQQMMQRFNQDNQRLQQLVMP